jgi:enoyl-CoA hydratase/carnithine racemase
MGPFSQGGQGSIALDVGMQGQRMAYTDLIYSVEDSIATITLNRPTRLNALSPNLEEELHRAFDEADGDRAVRVIILTGAGQGFCAGFDQGPNKSGRRNSDPHGKSMAEFIEYCQRRQGQRIGDWQHMWRLGKPIIAAVNGWAMGAGFWYQLAADITIASDQAVFAQPEVRHISATSFLFTALCGWKVANRWALTGDHFDAQEALRIGMVNEVVPHDQLMETARALAKRIALVPEPAVRLNKAVAMLGIQAAGLHSALLLEGTLGALSHASHNEYREKLFEVHRKEGVKAYLDMRDGPFQPEPMGPRSAKARAARAKREAP